MHRIHHPWLLHQFSEIVAEGKFSALNKLTWFTVYNTFAQFSMQDNWVQIMDSESASYFLWVTSSDQKINKKKLYCNWRVDKNKQLCSWLCDRSQSVSELRLRKNCYLEGGTIHVMLLLLIISFQITLLPRSIRLFPAEIQPLWHRLWNTSLKFGSFPVHKVSWKSTWNYLQDPLILPAEAKNQTLERDFTLEWLFLVVNKSMNSAWS